MIIQWFIAMVAIYFCIVLMKWANNEIKKLKEIRKCNVDEFEEMYNYFKTKPNNAKAPNASQKAVRRWWS
jgi:hypothetical protein